MPCSSDYNGEISMEKGEKKKAKEKLERKKNEEDTCDPLATRVRVREPLASERRKNVSMRKNTYLHTYLHKLEMLHGDDFQHENDLKYRDMASSSIFINVDSM
ncbi:hypothetical protein BOTCAL_0091g00310 [Botryotinia calthae]|uniref:Uncharacterized protein n=1 Tax=Botryotinia calthae TaxID=38488 RepID=A0A4Y8D783_9HELO|nr:hypothetical protein BOTCAL_0091g00310 [Botryotinia calthae]